jgi:adenine-specific DNA-methyltransferase
MPIKYLGSKRRLVPALGDVFSASGGGRALDLFTGTTRVAQELKRRGGSVTAVDSARYSEVFARCYIETDATAVDPVALTAKLDELARIRPQPGYVTETFCEQSRYFTPENGARIDVIRDALEQEDRDSPDFAILLTSLIEAADRVDSTTGLQMAYLKSWAPRAANPLELRLPELIPDGGRAVRGDAVALSGALGSFDFAYLDPPYNQHRYFTNYHVWETLVAWDAPEHYGVACKRIDARADETKSRFNQRRAMPEALRRVIADVRARVVVVSYNDEAWVSVDELREWCAVHGHVEVLNFDSRRYVGAQIGIHNPKGERVGTVSHVRNREHVVVAGERHEVEHLVDAAAQVTVRA